MGREQAGNSPNVGCVWVGAVGALRGAFVGGGGYVGNVQLLQDKPQLPKGET